MPARVYTFDLVRPSVEPQDTAAKTQETYAMASRKDPTDISKKEALKLANPSTRKKNLAGQTNGQWEHDAKRRTGQFTGAGEAPLMKK
jgi:hypothetical protein